jgi:hypothetical protein
MNKEQQELVGDAYKNHILNLSSVEIHDVLQHDNLITQEEFINKIKTDDEFAKKWGVEVEVRELSFDERYDLCAAQKSKMTAISEEDYIKYNIPTRAISLTYNNKTIENYE